MKKIFDILFSMKLTAVLFLLIAFASGAATFIENDFGTQGAKALIYNALWFEILIALSAVNLIGNIFRYKMYKKEKLSLFAFHISIIFIIAGAALTRYAGYEGMMHIRNGDTTNTITSSDTFVQAKVYQDGKAYEASKQVMLSALTNNDFTLAIPTPKGEVTVKYADFFQNAAEIVKPSDDGLPFISLLASISGGQPEKIDIFYGSHADIAGLAIYFGPQHIEHDLGLVIDVENGKLTTKAPHEMKWLSMKDNSTGGLAKDSAFSIEKTYLYGIGNITLALQDFIPKASKEIIGVKEKTGISALASSVSFNNETKNLTVYGSSSMLGDEKIAAFGDTKIELSYGAKNIELPFSIKLDKFVLDRYPGSMSPSSYESFVTVIDEKNGVKMPFHIYMNNILVYGGYRFYQSSYDQDEQGTVLSVSSDPGLIPTYIGYFLMIVGLIWIIFAKEGRFRKIAASINNARTAAALTTVALLFTTAPLAASDINKEHANGFSNLLVQDVQGRIKPIDTLSMEIINKLYRGYTIDGNNANQAVLGMIAFPQEWQTKKMIKVSHPEINRLLGVAESDKYVSFADFFVNTQQGITYKLSSQAETANRKKALDRDKFDKELIKADEKANIAYMVFNADVFKIFPQMNSNETRWFTPAEAIQGFDAQNSQIVRNLIVNYVQSVQKASQNGDWQSANAALDEIKKYQSEHGANVIPSQSIINAEILFNKFNIFERLAPFYLIIGFVLMIMLFASILRNKPPIKNLANGLFYLLAVGFLVHTFGLGLRWYVAGHAPWSNGYESLIYISWATILAGLLFYKKSFMTLAATSVLSGLTLFVAHLSWMDPQITNLVPVLKSYWLTIHVSVISASYGFLALSSLLGFITMILFILRNKEKANIDYSITELTKVNELSIMIGLAMLSIGNLLGAIWANESWGRYWSWDAKETWTLVSILIYAFIVHTRFIPKLKTAYFNALLTTIAFSTIIMTYFGVNYYLSGLHSYAAGDPIPVPDFVYYTIAIVAIVAITASRKRDSAIPLEK